MAHCQKSLIELKRYFPQIAVGLAKIPNADEFIIFFDKVAGNFGYSVDGVNLKLLQKHFVNHVKRAINTQGTSDILSNFADNDNNQMLLSVMLPFFQKKEKPSFTDHLNVEVAINKIIYLTCLNSNGEDYAECRKQLFAEILLIFPKFDGIYDQSNLEHNIIMFSRLIKENLDKKEQFIELFIEFAKDARCIEALMIDCQLCLNVISIDFNIFRVLPEIIRQSLIEDIKQIEGFVEHKRLFDEYQKRINELFAAYKKKIIPVQNALNVQQQALKSDSEQSIGESVEILDSLLKQWKNEYQEKEEKLRGEYDVEINAEVLLSKLKQGSCLEEYIESFRRIRFISLLSDRDNYIGLYNMHIVTRITYLLYEYFAEQKAITLLDKPSYIELTGQHTGFGSTDLGTIVKHYIKYFMIQLNMGNRQLEERICTGVQPSFQGEIKLSLIEEAIKDARRINPILDIIFKHIILEGYNEEHDRFFEIADNLLNIATKYYLNHSAMLASIKEILNDFTKNYQILAEQIRSIKETDYNKYVLGEVIKYLERDISMEIKQVTKSEQLARKGKNSLVM